MRILKFTLIKSKTSYQELGAFLKYDQYRIEKHNREANLLILDRALDENQQLLLEIWFSENRYDLK
jgi:hypothetical protein